MKQYSEKDLVDTLKKVGIKKDSTILIHSAIHVLGKMNSVKNEYIPKKILLLRFSNMIIIIA